MSIGGLESLTGLETDGSVHFENIGRINAHTMGVVGCSLRETITPFAQTQLTTSERSTALLSGG
jgi:hypothetical protein